MIWRSMVRCSWMMMRSCINWTNWNSPKAKWQRRGNGQRSYFRNQSTERNTRNCPEVQTISLQALPRQHLMELCNETMSSYEQSDAETHRTIRFFVPVSHLVFIVLCRSRGPCQTTRQGTRRRWIYHRNTWLINPFFWSRARNDTPSSWER